MNAGNIDFTAKRCFPPDKPCELRFVESCQDRRKARRRLRMTMARIVTDAVGMRHKQCRHCDNLS